MNALRNRNNGGNERDKLLQTKSFGESGLYNSYDPSRWVSNPQTADKLRGRPTSLDSLRPSISIDEFGEVGHYDASLNSAF